MNTILGILTASPLATAAFVVNVVLCILTGTYVVFTNRLVRQAIIANQQTQDAFRRQFQFATYPHLTCSVRRGDHDRTEIVLRNSGTLPAVDVDIWALESYHSDTLPVAEFIQRFVKDAPEIRKRLLDADGGFYSLFDRLIYFEVPQRKQVMISLQAPLRSDTVHILLQFRDLTGVNYAKVYWFFWDEKQGRDRFRLGSITPEALKVAARVDYNEDLKLRTADNSDVSAIAGHDFVASWESSIPSGYVKGSILGVEDKGVWSDI